MKLNIKIILLTFINTMFLNNLITSNILIHYFPKNAYLISLFLGLTSSSFYLLLKKTNYQKEVLNSVFKRILLIIYIVISTIMILLLLFKLLSINYFYLTPVFLLIIIFMFFIVLSSKVNIKIIMNMMIISYVILMFFSQIHIINTNNRDFLLIKNISLNLNKSYLSLFLICFYLDNLLFLITPPITNKEVSKYSYFIGSIIGTIISTWFIIDNYLFVNYKYFIDELFPSFLRFKFYMGPKYIEHLDVFLCIYLVSYVFIKVLFNLELFRTLIRKKNTFNYRLIITTIISLSLILLINNINLSFKLLLYSSLLLTVILIIFYLSLRSKKT